MDALEQFLGAASTKPVSSTRVTSQDQAMRDRDALTVIETELKKSQAGFASATDPQVKARHQADISSLQSELARIKPAFVQQAPQVSGDPLTDYLSATPPETPTKAAKPIENKPNSISSFLTDTFNKTQEIKRGLGDRVLGAFDTVYGGIVPTGYGAIMQGLARLDNTPKRAEEIGQAYAASIDKPLGKAFGITNKEGYKNPLGGATEPIVEQANKMFNKLGMTPEQIAEKTGVAAEDIRHMVVIGSAAIPKVVSGVAKPIRQAVSEIKTAKLSMADAQAQFEAIKGKAPKSEVSELTKNVDQFKQQFEQQKAAGMAKSVSPEAPPVPNPLTGETILPIETQKPAASQFGTSKPTTPEAPYTELHYSEKGLPLDEQYARVKELEKVLGADHPVDMAAVEGKGKERATNFDVSRTDTPQGNLLAERIADEQKRLTKYGEGLIAKSGGTLGLDEASSYKRGNTLLAPFEEYGNHLDKKIGELYAERDKTAKDVPVQANFTKDLLNDDAIILLNDNEKLAKASKAKMTQLGIMDKEGNLSNTTAYTAEQFRKWLNSPNVWSPQNAGLHRALKDSIDNDVFAHADYVIYKDARTLFELKKNTLDNPKGIATILDESGPNGINRKVDVEKISQKIAGMGVDQFTHIIDTLDKMPVGMQVKAQKAKAEIKAQFLNQALEQKSANKLTTYMNDNREVMNRLFTTEEMADVRSYHNASHILKTDIGYKGSAVQGINVEKKLFGKIGEQLFTKGAAAAAETAFMGAGHGIPAAVAHGWASGKIEKSYAKKVAQAEQKAFDNTQKRFIPISDLINKDTK